MFAFEEIVKYYSDLHYLAGEKVDFTEFQTISGDKLSTYSEKDDQDLLIELTGLALKDASMAEMIKCIEDYINNDFQAF